jgi:hypothetical protein
MTAYKESLSLFRKIAPGLKVFLIIYMSFVLLPIDHTLQYFNIDSKFQVIVSELQFRFIHYIPRRVIVTLVLIYAFLINDPMLVALMVLFMLHSTRVNYKIK